MPVHNADIAACFEEIAELLEIQGGNAFRIRAYHNAARTVGDLGTELSVMLAQGRDLTDLPGIGKDLAAQITEIIRTGTSARLKELHKSVPPSVTEMLRLPGLGPKRVKVLMEQLGVRTLKQLQQAAQSGRIRQLSGFGEKSERQILQSLQAHLATESRFKLAVAKQYADALLAYLESGRMVQQAAVAGSYRRARDTVGDLDILVSTTAPGEVMQHFVAYDEVKEVIAQGPTRSTVILRSGLQVDLRAVPAESFGAALQYFTGSKAHNIAIRRLGQQRGLKINEYGVFKGDKRVGGDTEISVYTALGLPYIAPELREDRGEIAAAQAGRLPALIALQDLKGDLHSHTLASDGRDSLEDMARAARKQGLTYLAITEHSRHLSVANGLDAERLARQMAEIDRINAKLPGIALLKSIEVDILEDGRLDLPDDVLSRLDLVVAAVHSHFKLSRAKQTARILRAMDAPHFTVLAHPSGRLLGAREAYAVDMERIIRAARQRGCFLELNAHPERLDLSDVYCNMAKSEGVLISIASDAHSVLDFANLRFAIGQARRGWLEVADVLNTRPLAKLRSLLRQTM